MKEMRKMGKQIRKEKDKTGRKLVNKRITQ
jgi:hypothetical protein